MELHFTNIQSFRYPEYSISYIWDATAEKLYGTGKTIFVAKQQQQYSLM